jgi:hypothetical protein
VLSECLSALVYANTFLGTVAEGPSATNRNIDLDESNILTGPAVSSRYTQHEHATRSSFGKAIAAADPAFLSVAVEDSIVWMPTKELSFRLAEQIRAELLTLYPTPRTARKELEIEIAVQQQILGEYNSDGAEEVPEDESLVDGSEGHSAVTGPGSDLAEASSVGGGASSEDDSDVFVDALERLESPGLMSSSPTPINPDAELEASPEGDSILEEFPIRRTTSGRRMFPRYPYVHSLDWEDAPLPGGDNL